MRKREGKFERIKKRGREELKGVLGEKGKFVSNEVRNRNADMKTYERLKKGYENAKKNRLNGDDMKPKEKKRRYIK